MAFERYTGESDGPSKEVIRERVPRDLVRLALKIDNIVKEVTDGKAKVRGSGRGVTYYPEKSWIGSAFLHLQPDQYETYISLHYDASAKKGVDASSIPKAAGKWTEKSNSSSYRWKLKVESPLEIQEQVREVIRRSYQQVSS